MQADGKTKMNILGTYRTDSIKKVIVAELNASTITEEQAWEKYVKYVKERAHSIRENIDSGINFCELIDDYGYPTILGNKFVNSCEKLKNNANAELPMEILRHAILKNGMLITFLINAFELSKEKFSKNPSAFIIKKKFSKAKYYEWLEGEFYNTLHIINKVTARGGTSRKPFQAELAVLNDFGFLSGESKSGVGLEINWSNVVRSLEFESQ